MCGIVGYIGHRDPLPILIQGLKRLEYRGYDSSGIALLNKKKIDRVRAVGKVQNLEEKVFSLSKNSKNSKKREGFAGIAHTRWATHGKVTQENAHPHLALKDKLTLVHNGIIENYREIKESLGEGIKLQSETDSEILLNLIAKYYESSSEADLLKAVKTALLDVVGTYGILVAHIDRPKEIIVARLGSPLVVGVGQEEYFIASDVTPLIPYTKNVVYLKDGEVAKITDKSFDIFSLNGPRVNKKIETVDWDIEKAEKGGFPHFMLKEIFDQPRVLEDALRGRIKEDENTAQLGGINMTESEMRKIERILIIGCGTAYYAGLGAKYAFEKLTGLPTEAEVASEFRYKNPVLNEKTLVFVLSQSGETIDTLMAQREAKRQGAVVRGIINVVGSTIAREVGAGTYIHAGPEFSVASTKAYSNTLAVLLLYALLFGRLKNTSSSEGLVFVKSLKELPQKIEQVLESSEKIKKIAEKFSSYNNFLYLGRGVNFPTALEGALKLKEISYIHSEACAGGEIKHGPIALLSPDFPVLAIMTKNSLYEKMKSNVQEVRVRGAKVLLVATEGDKNAKDLADEVIFVPKTHELLEPILNAIPLQLFSYHVAVSLGRDVDRPRNLAKSVTVE